MKTLFLALYFLASLPLASAAPNTLVLKNDKQPRTFFPNGTFIEGFTCHDAVFGSENSNVCRNACGFEDLQRQRGAPVYLQMKMNYDQCAQSCGGHIKEMCRSQFSEVVSAEEFKIFKESIDAFRNTVGDQIIIETEAALNKAHIVKDTRAAVKGDINEVRAEIEKLRKDFLGHTETCASSPKPKTK